MKRVPTVSDADVALLRTIARERSVVGASRSIGISRDRAAYRIARMERAFGGPVVASVRGGREFGTTRLTELGDRIVREGFDTIELLNSRTVSPPAPSNRISGVYRSGPSPAVEPPGGPRLRVAFPATEGERVTVLLDPEAILLARARFPSSARNVVPARVTRVRRAPGPGGSTVELGAGTLRLRAAVTAESIRQLRLRPGARVWLYVKAMALRRVGPSPRRKRGAPAVRGSRARAAARGR